MARKKILTMSKRPLSDQNGSNFVKKPRYSCKFKSEWIKEFDFIAKSTKGMEYARCKVCGVDFSVSNSGRCDITKHSKTAIHSKSMESLQSTSRLTSFIARRYDECNKAI